jgi:hypothetical protein
MYVRPAAAGPPAARSSVRGRRTPAPPPALSLLTAPGTAYLPDGLLGFGTGLVTIFDGCAERTDVGVFFSGGIAFGITRLPIRN